VRLRPCHQRYNASNADQSGYRFYHKSAPSEFIAKSNFKVTFVHQGVEPCRLSNTPNVIESNRHTKM
jgi:hypothetical protein